MVAAILILPRAEGNQHLHLWPRKAEVSRIRNRPPAPGRDAYHDDPKDDVEAEDPRTHGLWKILFISTVTSIDSLGVGVTLGLAGKPILDYAVPITVAAFASTYLGLGLARRMPAAFGSRLEIVGGAVLIALGFKMLSI